MFDSFLVKHCAPTLGGLKTANLFNYTYSSKKDLLSMILYWNKELNPKGIFIHILRRCDKNALIYVYRSSKLVKDFQKPKTQQFLMQFGYCEFSPERCIARLKERFKNNASEFPHEIGMFLGYPIEDVRGFIDNVGKNSICSGYWKVYGNEIETLKLFEKYTKCKKIYVKLFDERVKSVHQLTVAV